LALASPPIITPPARRIAGFHQHARRERSRAILAQTHDVGHAEAGIGFPQRGHVEAGDARDIACTGNGIRREINGRTQRNGHHPDRQRRAFSISHCGFGRDGAGLGALRGGNDDAAGGQQKGGNALALAVFGHQVLREVRIEFSANTKGRTPKDAALRPPKARPEGVSY
jgi:hypothetical protein